MEVDILSLSHPRVGSVSTDRGKQSRVLFVFVSGNPSSCVIREVRSMDIWLQTLPKGN